MTRIGGLTLTTLMAAAALMVASSSFAQRPPKGDVGHDAYQYWCATCHGTGPGHPGTTALAAKYKGARPGVLEERTDLTPQGVRFFVRQGVSIMPFFRKTEISDPDLEAIAQYLTRQATRAAEAPKP